MNRRDFIGGCAAVSLSAVLPGSAVSLPSFTTIAIRHLPEGVAEHFNGGSWVSLAQGGFEYAQANVVIRNDGHYRVTFEKFPAAEYRCVAKAGDVLRCQVAVGSCTVEHLK